MKDLIAGMWGFLSGRLSMQGWFAGEQEEKHRGAGGDLRRWYQSGLMEGIRVMAGARFDWK